ncbi:MAG: hypothetical protein ACR2QL_04820 [Woeseiaceae bacterium]
MTLEDLANFGEVIGAIAVVISLVYLAIQIRQNSTQINENSQIARLLMQENFVSGQEAFCRLILENENVHRIWNLGFSADGEIESDSDRDLYGFVLYGQMYRYHVMYQARLIEPLEYERCLIHVDRLAGQRPFVSWWSRHRSSFVFDVEFAELVDSRIKLAASDADT